MKNQFANWMLALGMLLMVSSCEPGTTPSNNGGHVTDTTAAPGPADGKAARPWAADKNQFDPNLLDVLPDPLDAYMLPFSYAFNRAQGIQSIEYRMYSDADNDALSEGAAEKDLVLSQKRIYAFDASGRPLDLLDEKFLGDATDPALRFHVAWTYGASRQLEKMTFEETMAGKMQTHATTCTYREDGRPVATEDANWMSTYMGYDDSLQHTYLLHKYPKDAPSDVWVVGYEGAFPDSICLALQADILSKRSKFIDYGKAGPKPINIVFLETKERQAIREVHMGRKGLIDYTITRKFNADGNVSERNYRWEEQGAKLSALTTYRYTPTGDLEEVLMQSKPFNGDLRNQIDRYTYGPDGLVSKMTRSTRKNNDPQVLEFVAYFSVNKATANPAPGNPQPGATQPGGTR